MNTQDHIEKLKTAADPYRVAVALGLQNRGRRFFCPSCQPHGGKTPDLVVGDKGFICHKCGTRGDLLTLIQVAGKMDFPSAVAWLEKETGIEPPERKKRGIKTRVGPRSFILDLSTKPKKEGYRTDVRSCCLPGLS